MKFHILILALSLFCISPLLAQDTASSLLWKVEGPGLESPSYIYGTIHLLCKDDLQLDGTLRDAFAATDRLVLELDMDDPGMFTGMQKSMVMTGGRKLKDLLTEEDYAALNQFFADSIGMGLGLVNRFKPFVVQSFMYPSLLGCSPVSYEEEFVRWAKKEKREVLGLESIAFQMSIFDQIPYEEQAKWLMETVNDYNGTRQDMQRLIAVYSTQNLDELNGWMVESMDEYEDYGEQLLDKRNANWVPKMQDFMKEGPTFFGVGAGHLGGANGVLALLREAGYTVSPISLQP